MLDLLLDVLVYAHEWIDLGSHWQYLVAKIKGGFVYSLVVEVTVYGAVWSVGYACHKALEAVRRRIAKARLPPCDSKRTLRSARRRRSKRRRARAKGRRGAASATDGDRAGKRANHTVIVTSNIQFFDLRVSSS